jgi:protein tyrosine kinase modulator
LHQQSLPGVAGEESSSVRPFLESAFRFRGLWITAVLSVVALSVAFVLFIPREYQSKMNILVENARSNYQITPQRTSGVIEVNSVTEEQINSEIQVLRSRDLANIVVDPRRNSESISTLSPEQLRAHDKAIEKFEKHLSVEMVRKSNIIDVTYTANDPATAKQMLSRLLTAFMAKQHKIGHPPGTAQFFATEAASYKQQLDNAQQQLAAYQQEHQIVSLPNTEETLNQQITETQNDLRGTDAQISEVSQSLNTQVAQLQHIPTRQLTQERTSPNDYSVEQMNTMLAQLENKRTSLLTQFTPNDRLVQEVNKQIADTRTALRNAEQTRSQEQSTNVNPVWEQVTSSIEQNEAERQALKARRAELTSQIQHLQGNLADTEGSTVAYSTLQQKVAELQNNYQLYAQKRDEAKMADAMDEDNILNVSVAQAPTFSITPSRPKPILDIVLGTFTAMFFASFMVFFAEMGRATIATPRELDACSRYPLLATVPLLSSWDRKRTAVERAKSGRLAIALVPAGHFNPGDATPEYENLRKEAQAS